MPHEALAAAFGMKCSTATRAIGRAWPLLAWPGVFASERYPAADLGERVGLRRRKAVTLGLQATEIQVRIAVTETSTAV